MAVTSGPMKTKTWGLAGGSLGGTDGLYLISIVYKNLTIN